ncbi:hypothetical protein M1555_03685 [Patescibacteria group bacterium]|nr:hypothetical protein [Patescibacteria group bacterium]
MTRASYHRKHLFTNLLLITLGVAVAVALSQNRAFTGFLLHLGTLGYIGAFVAGILFVSTFTASVGILVLFLLAETLSPIEIALLAGLGAVVGDLLVFRYVRDDLLEDMQYLYKKFGSRHLHHLLRTRYFRWSLPVIGAVIIASPLPDELGVTLMGISKMKTLRFIPVSFFLNSLGIFTVISAVHLIGG